MILLNKTSPNSARKDAFADAKAMVVNMNLVRITHENIENEHICCAISNNKDIQVMSKKNWLKERLDEGLVFLKCDVRGKCFIEYIPAENAWLPIDAVGYMVIDCLWVSGQFKGHGYSNLLLDECIKESKEKCKKGLVILSSEKKLGFLADPEYLQYKGFELADAVAPYFKLMYLPFGETSEIPRFKPFLREKISNRVGEGFTLYYTSQCPFTAKYVPILGNIAKERKVKFQAVHITTKEQAQNAPTPFTTFTLFYNGEFVTHEILSEKKFNKILDSKEETE